MKVRNCQRKDGRPLLTLTVRSSSTDGNSLGLRGLVSDDDGETWDFDRDRLVIDDQNHNDGWFYDGHVELPIIEG